MVLEEDTEEDTEEVVMSAALLRIVKHGYSVSWFKHRVFPYLGPNVKDTIDLLMHHCGPLSKFKVYQIESFHE